MAVKNCLKGCVGERASKKGYFKPYESPILYPWVKVWVEGENFEISTGNISSKKYEAQVKSMNLGISNGIGVKIEIVDESGGQFERFFRKISCSNIAKQDKMMKFQWGYKTQTTMGTMTDIAIPTDDNVCPPGGKLPSPNEQVFTSKVHRLSITNIECQAMSAGCFKFIITGTDLFVSLMGMVDNRTFGGDKNSMHLTDAIRALFAPTNHEVEFVEINNDGSTIPLKFDVPANACKSSGIAEAKTKGPCGKWESNNRSPLITAINWLNSTKTLDNRGFVYGYREPSARTKNKPVVVFSKTIRDPRKPFDENRILGTYIVNASTCTPVISFNPNFNFSIFQGTNTGAISPAGSAEAATFKVGQKEIGLVPGMTPKDMKNLVNAGISQVTNIGPMSWIWVVGEAAKYTQQCASANAYANMYTRPIEAEMKIQGNPAYECIALSHFFGLNIVYANPFRPRQAFLGEFGSAEWFQGNPSSFGLTTDSCNPIFSNANWLITGISHDIHDGSYFTTLKLYLYAPGLDLPPNSNLGGTQLGFKFPCN